MRPVYHRVTVDPRCYLALWMLPVRKGNVVINKVDADYKVALCAD